MKLELRVRGVSSITNDIGICTSPTSAINISDGRGCENAIIASSNVLTSPAASNANQTSSLCLSSGHVACNGALFGCNNILFIKQATIRPGTIRDLNIGRKLHLVAL